MTNGLLFIIWWVVYTGTHNWFWWIRAKYWNAQYTPGDRAGADLIAYAMFFVLWFWVIKP